MKFVQSVVVDPRLKFRLSKLAICQCHRLAGAQIFQDRTFVIELRLNSSYKEDKSLASRSTLIRKFSFIEMQVTSLLNGTIKGSMIRSKHQSIRKSKLKWVYSDMVNACFWEKVLKMMFVEEIQSGWYHRVCIVLAAWN